jgi:hypothetical protein
MITCPSSGHEIIPQSQTKAALSVGYQRISHVTQKLLLTAIFVAGLALPASAAVLYDDGANDNANFTNATPFAPLINGGHATSDTFVLSQESDVMSVNFALMTYASELGIRSVDWSITSLADAGTVYGSGTSDLTNVPEGLAPQTVGFSDFSSTFSVGSLDLGPGTYWLTLQNAVSPTGSVDAFWAESDGPSQASLDGLELDPANYTRSGVCTTPGSSGDCSQSFAIDGTVSAISATPGPATWALMIGGFACVGAMKRRARRQQSCPRLNVARLSDKGWGSPLAMEAVPR